MILENYQYQYKYLASANESIIATLGVYANEYLALRIADGITNNWSGDIMEDGTVQPLCINDAYVMPVTRGLLNFFAEKNLIEQIWLNPQADGNEVWGLINL